VFGVIDTSLNVVDRIAFQRLPESLHHPIVGANMVLVVRFAHLDPQSNSSSVA
jgi:hypothetical protein